MLHHCIYSRSCDARWRCYTAGCWTIGENVDRKSRSNFSERIDEGIESDDSAKRYGFEQWRNFRDWRLPRRDDAFRVSNFVLRAVMAQQMCLRSTIANALRHRWKCFSHTSRPAPMMVCTIFERAFCGIIPEKMVFGNPRWMGREIAKNVGSCEKNCLSEWRFASGHAWNLRHRGVQYNPELSNYCKYIRRAHAAI